VATNFPASLDSLTNPTSSDSLNSPSHSAQHANVNDAVEALQVKVGADSSAVTSSHDYKIANLESRPVETKTASYTLVAADVNKRIVMNSASATTITVNTGIFSAGDSVWIHNIGAGTTTVTAGTATVNTAGSLDVGQWEGGSLYFTSASSAIFFRGGGAGVTDVIAEYVVVAGGGGGGIGGSYTGPGGGGGGYLSSYGTENSGGGFGTWPKAALIRGTSYTVTIGAGGAANSIGSNTDFSNIRALGGGNGGPNESAGGTGGSGGGAGTSNSTLRAGGAAIANLQGYAGGANHAVYPTGGGGGGGAGGAGAGGNYVVANGGVGVDSSITGSAVGRAGGGAGGYGASTATDGGGGKGANGTANTGGGGGGSGGGTSGGSGVVILRFLTSDGSPTIGAGLTSSTSTDGDYTVIEFTAGSDTISWSV